KAGAWYLVASADGELRTYRISSIEHAVALDAHARRPKQFDLARHWAKSVQRFETELYSGHADVLATAAGLRSLRYQNAAVARAVAAAAPSRRKDGRAALRIPIESIEHATGQLLRLAPEVEIVSPLALRRSVVVRL